MSFCSLPFCSAVPFLGRTVLQIEKQGGMNLTEKVMRISISDAEDLGDIMKYAVPEILSKTV